MKQIINPYKKTGYTLLFLFIALSTSCSSGFSGKAPPIALKGVVDLTEWDFKKDGPVEIKGEWEFYWNQLLEPGDFPITSPEAPPEYITVPGSWTKNNYMEKNCQSMDTRLIES